MKITFYKRNDFTSLAFIGERVMQEFAKQYEIIEQNIGGELNSASSDVAILYGLPQDLAYLKRHKKRYAGLVCETDLAEKDIEFIKKAELTEIWVPSKFCAEIYRKAGFENVRIVPHGVDELPIAKCYEDNILMIYTSYPTLSWTTLRKNPFMAMEAVRKFDKRLLLRTEKQRYYNRFNLSNVEFVDYQKDLNDVYDRCSCVLCPSDAEGFGMIGLEALARGLPLISTRTGNDYLEGMSYIHIDSVVTTEKIYDALEELYNHWDEYNDKALKQRKIIFKKYNWSKILSKITL